MAEVLDRTMLKALSTDTRQDIIKFLMKRPYTASELSKLLSKHVTTVTEHLNILENSGLIRKKESTNKWVYYTLTEKGEKLFKPAYYSWVVVFAVSAVLMFTGFLRVFSYGTFGTASESAMSASKELTSQAAVSEAVTTTSAAQTTITTIDVLAISLIVLALLGFAYIGYKFRKQKKLQKEMTMYLEGALL